MIKKLLISAIFLIALFILPRSVGATAYYIDTTFGTSCDGNGLATTTAFCEIDAFTDVARTAGDIAFVRRGVATTTAALSDLTFTSDGTLNAPITLTADYDNLWSDFSSSTVTWTPTFGSKFMASSASSTDFTVTNNWIYLQGDCSERPYGEWNTGTTTNPCEFAYEVASTSPDGLSLYLPYKGNQSGSGKNMRVMPFAPEWNIPAGDFQLQTSQDYYWVFKGISFSGTDSACTLFISQSSFEFYDTILQGNGVTDCGITNGNATFSYFYKTRLFGFLHSIFHSYALNFYNTLGDCNSVTNSIFIRAGLNGNPNFHDLEVVNCTDTIVYNASPGNSTLQSVFIRNGRMILDTGNTLGANAPTTLAFEDAFSTVGLNYRSSNQVTTDGASTTTVSSTANLRSGGGPNNLLVSPHQGTGNTGISTYNFPFSYIKLFEYPIYTDTSSKTYTMWFNSTSTGNFLVDPFTSTQPGSTTPELFIECEYYADASDADRQLKRSNTPDDVDFNGSTDWQDISVTCQPSQAGVLYLRGWYAKPRETGALNSNIFYMDTRPVIQ